MTIQRSFPAQCCALILACTLGLTSLSFAQVTIGGANFPFINAGPPPVGQVGQAYNFLATVNGGVAPYTFSVSGNGCAGNACLPPGLTLNTASGVISGIPTQAGTYPFNLQVTDTNGNFTALPFSITITQPLSLTNGAPPTTGTTGVSYGPFTFTGSGGQTPYSFALVSGSLPVGLSLIGPILSGTPTQVGTFTFNIQLTDALGNHVMSPAYSIVVSNGAAKLIITNGPCGGGTVGAVYSCAITTSGGTPPVTCTLASGSLPAGTSLGGTGNCTISGTPTTATTYNFSILASDSGGQTATAGPYAVTIVNSAPALQFTTTTCPNGVVGQAYNCTLNATGGTPPYVFSLQSGANPSGTSLTTTNSIGTVAGNLTTAQTVTPTYKVTDFASNTATLGPLTITITSTASGDDSRYCGPGDVWTGGASDGPAALMHACTNTAMANTPSPGSTFTASNCGNVQSTITSAAAVHGTAVIPASLTGCGAITVTHTGSATQWLTIRTDQFSGTTVAGFTEGTRATPCAINIASLAGYVLFGTSTSLYPCTSASRLMPQLTCTTANCTVINFGSGTNFVRIMGIEVIGPSSVNSNNYLVPINNNNDHIILDRMVIHGFPNPTFSTTLEDKGGVTTNGSTHLAIINSYIYDFLCVKGGACVDSQGIAGGLGGSGGGPIKIVNNLIAASGESWLFGGGAATATPADFEIRRNDSFKPLTWFLSKGSTGQFPIVKNNGEMKNAIRILYEGNYFQNNWSGLQGDQFGTLVLFTPKNQQVNGVGVCPTCIVTDFTVRYNRLSHAVNGIAASTALSDPPAFAASLGVHRGSVHDNLMDDLNAVTYDNAAVPCCSFGFMFKMSNDHPLMADWPDHFTVNHNTGITTGFSGGKAQGLLFQCDGAGGSSQTTPVTYFAGFVFENNIGSEGTGGFLTPGCGKTIPSVNGHTGTYNILDANECSGNDGVTGCDWTFTKNLSISGVFTGQGTGAPYPPTNQTCGTSSATCFPTSPTSLFVNYNNNNGGDYHLATGSPYKAQGTDGLDLGANVDLVNQYTSGVQ